MSGGKLGSWNRYGLARLVALLAAALVPFAPLLAQAPAPAGQPSPSSLMTPWGVPDLQGIWISGDLTPVETPDKRIKPVSQPCRDGFPGNDFTTDRTATTDPVVQYKGPKRQSLITEPPSGRLSIKQSAIDERDYNLMHLNDSYVNQTLWERCISAARTVSSPVRQRVSDPADAGNVAIFYELLHVPRIIPISNNARTRVEHPAVDRRLARAIGKARRSSSIRPISRQEHSGVGHDEPSAERPAAQRSAFTRSSVSRVSTPRPFVPGY